MKKIFILFAAALTIGLTGCQSFLEEETYGSTTEIFKAVSYTHLTLPTIYSV